MSSMVWSQELSVGLENIDSQHKELIKRINDLFDACTKGQGRLQVVETLSFLQSYTVKHFADEEKYMLSIKYPEYPTQKSLHTKFIADLNKLQEELSKSGSSITIVANANTMLSSWLLAHIKIQDTKIGVFVRANK